MRWLPHAATLLALGGCELSVEVGDALRRADAATCDAPFVATDVSLGEEHACAVDTSGHAYCWGYGGSGQLGDGETVDRLIPRAVLTNDLFTDVDVGSVGSCARRTDGALLCWGDNFTGLLADGTDQSSATPVVTLASVGAFDVHDGSMLAIVPPDALWVWGGNPYGLLGLGAAAADVTLRAETDANTVATAVAAGANHTCILDGAGHARCAGDDTSSQLGVGSAPSPVYVAVDDRFTFVALDAGYDRTCGILDTGELRCWGKNDPPLNPLAGPIAAIPLKVGTDLDYSAVSVGFDHVCALRAGGRLFCWGSGDHLALSVPGDSATPVEVLPGTAFSQVTAGRDATCAVRAGDRAVLCWGRGTSGQLGRGDRHDGSPAIVCAPSAP